jgi:hypothetical protein
LYTIGASFVPDIGITCRYKFIRPIDTLEPAEKSYLRVVQNTEQEKNWICRVLIQSREDLENQSRAVKDVHAGVEETLTRNVTVQ